jgi:hypothetical protein
VTVEGPIGSRHLGRFRALRYEVRVSREGTVADVDEAVASPQHPSNDEPQALRVLEMAALVLAFVWGRDQLGTGEMWNSNSVISWVLARSDLPAAEIQPPEEGRRTWMASGRGPAQRLLRSKLSARRPRRRWPLTKDVSHHSKKTGETDCGASGY